MYIGGIDKENLPLVMGFFPEDIEENIEKDGFVAYVALEDTLFGEAQPLGVVSFFVDVAEDFDTEVPEAFLDWIFVAPEQRGRGVGTFLMTELKRSITDAGIEKLYADIPEDDEELKPFFSKQKFLFTEDALESYLGTVGDLKKVVITGKKDPAYDLWDSVDEETETELTDLISRVKKSNKKTESEEVHVDFDTEEKAEIFDRLFPDSSMTMINSAVWQGEDKEYQNLPAESEAVLSLNPEITLILPRFYTLVDYVSETDYPYETGADEEDGPYILMEPEEDLVLKLTIVSDPVDTELCSLCITSEFYYDEDTYPMALEVLSDWEEIAQFTAAAEAPAYRQISFFAGIPCENGLPDEEDVLSFIENIITEIKVFVRMTKL